MSFHIVGVGESSMAFSKAAVASDSCFKFNCALPSCTCSQALFGVNVIAFSNCGTACSYCRRSM